VEELTIPTRSHTSFKKRQKEIARMEKQKEKAAKRMQGKLEHLEGPTVADIEYSEVTAPADETMGTAE
jgi:hypothetical protein